MGEARMAPPSGASPVPRVIKGTRTSGSTPTWRDLCSCSQPEAAVPADNHDNAVIS